MKILYSLILVLLASCQSNHSIYESMPETFTSYDEVITINGNHFLREDFHIKERKPNSKGSVIIDDQFIIFNHDNFIIEKYKIVNSLNNIYLMNQRAHRLWEAMKPHFDEVEILKEINRHNESKILKKKNT